MASLTYERAAARTVRRPLATWRDDLITMAIAFWPITAMFFDGRNHDNRTGQETFFTLTHSILYGGLLVCTTGIRSMWAKPGYEPSFKRFAPALLSAILFVGVAGFITMYLSTFMTDVTPTSAFMNDLKHFHDVRSNQAISLNAGLTRYGDDTWPYSFYSASHGMASEIVTTLVLIGPALLLMRRWRVPFGAFTLIYLGFGLLVNILTEYRDWVLIAPPLVLGITLDLFQRRAGKRLELGGIRAVGPLAAGALWLSFYGVLALDKGIGWGGSLLVGALAIGTLTGFGLAFVIAPPPYEPAPA